MRPSVLRAAAASLLPTALWLAVAGLLLLLPPDRAWRFKYHGLFALGAVGLWRYAWQLLNALRSYSYALVRFPRLRREAREAAARPPKRVYVVVASYREQYRINELCFTSLVRECRGLASAVTVVVSVGSEAEARQITDLVESSPGHERIRLLFTLQAHGKRLALGYALRVVARDYNSVSGWHEDAANDVVVLMDGDTALAPGAIANCLPHFRAHPDVGGVTTDEVATVLGDHSELVRSWYDLKLIRRHHLMQSHSLSWQLLTLTGRFSLVRASVAASEEFIQALDRDHLVHWLHGVVRFLMGDDKSTLFCLMKNGWRMLYVPDATAYALEDRTHDFLRLSKVLMLRWYGNMLRNSGRSLALGVGRLPVFIWLCLLDQRLSMWTSLIGPVAAVLLSLTASAYYLWFYAAWVVLTRLAQLWLLVPHGYAVRFADLPLLVWDQWYGSLVKIYCSCHLHRQVWQKARSEAQVLQTVGSHGKLRRALPGALLAVYAAAFLAAVGYLSGAFRFPRPF
jgi:glycosyltransferase Alg8